MELISISEHMCMDYFLPLIYYYFFFLIEKSVLKFVKVFRNHPV
jgi:hypothetical protein